jgi:hypothetical protein
LLLKLIEESKMFEKLKSNPTKYHTEVSTALNQLEFIVSRMPDNLINIFRLDSEEGSQDIELHILRAFLNCKIIIIF